jgi:hypothetical protein
MVASLEAFTRSKTAAKERQKRRCMIHDLPNLREFVQEPGRELDREE